MVCHLANGYLPEPLATILKNVNEKPYQDMRYLLYLTILSIFLMSCEKTVPDPYPIHDPDPSKFYANQTILDTIPILSIAFDNDGTAWIGTQHRGLVKYGLTQTKVFNSQNSIISNFSIRDIAIDSENHVWLGADGLIKFDGEKFYRLNSDNSNIPEDVVWSTAVDSNDDVWVASNRAGSGGIAKFDGEQFEVFTPENSPLPFHSTHAIAIDNEDNVWAASMFGAYESYLSKISEDSWTVYDSSDFKHNLFEVLDLEINSKNQLCGVINYSLPLSMYHTPNAFCFDGIHMDTYGVDSIRGCQTIFVDNNDNLWCTFGHGYVCFVGDEHFRVVSEVIDINGVSTYATWFSTISQAPDGNIWIGTGEGIRIIEGIE